MLIYKLHSLRRFYTAWLLLLTEMYVLYGQLQIVKLIHLGQHFSCWEASASYAVVKCV